MKYMPLKYWIIILVFAFILTMIGAWMKILHKPFADHLLTIGLILKIVAIIFIAIKLIRNPKFKDILDK